MASYLRSIRVPEKNAEYVQTELTKLFGTVYVEDILIAGKPYTSFKFVSDKPIIVKTSAKSVPHIERNANKDAVAPTNILKRIAASDLDLGAVLSFNLAAITTTTESGGPFTVPVTVKDAQGIETVLNVVMHVSDTVAPVITLAHPTISRTMMNVGAFEVSAIEATAVDNGDDVTAEIVVTFFEADGTTPIANIGDFITYLINDYEGGLSGKIKFNFTDDDDNAAETKVATVTVPANVESTLSFDTDGGTEVDDIVDFHTKPIEEPEAPTKEDHTFDGWYDNAELTGDAITWPYAMPLNDKTLYAKWTFVG